MCKFHSKGIWVVGGDGPTYGLNESLTAAQTKVCQLLRDEGEVVWAGANTVR